MAVISELIDAGLALKEKGNHQAAIEHFRQLHTTYPNHARIMFELAGSWQAFNVPEQAIPLYQALLDMPKTEGLPPKDMPRLYTQMGASLRLMGRFSESLQIIEEGLHQFPTYRPLRAYHMFALHSAGFHQNAMVESLKLMLESLAPTKWDVYEDEIVAIVKDIRDRVPPPDTTDLEDWEFDEFWGDEIKRKSDEDQIEIDAPEDTVEAEAIDESPVEADTEDEVAEDETPEPEPIIIEGKIVIDDEDETDDKGDESFDIQVKVVNKDTKKKKPSQSSKKDSKQFGKKPVKIDINAVDDDESPPPKPAKTEPDDDAPPPKTGKIDIPIDFD